MAVAAVSGVSGFTSAFGGVGMVGAIFLPCAPCGPRMGEGALLPPRSPSTKDIRTGSWSSLIKGALGQK